MMVRKYHTTFIKDHVSKAMRELEKKSKSDISRQMNAEKLARLAFIKFLAHGMATEEIELADDDMLLIFGA
jgi:hypothetical protein